MNTSTSQSKSLTRRHTQRVTLLTLVISAAFLALTIARPALAAEKPNIVLCMTDDQGWGDVAYNGHPVLKTPVLDEMAKTGLRLDRFYAAAPVCSPTRGSVLTGRHPNRFGCFKWGRTLRPAEITVAEALKKAGYATGHFGKWHLGSMVAGAPNSPGDAGFDEWKSSPNFYENNPLFSHNGRVIETDGESSRVTVDAALPFMRAAAKRKQPFLAVIWFGNPHTPHQALPELRAMYPDQPAKLQNYYGEITGVDQAMGDLRQALRTMGVADDTLVWFTSDNGARSPGSNGGLRGQKGSLWEGGIRVPCVIEWPARIKSPQHSSVRGNTCDIYPTLLELTGVTMKDQPPLDGVSLMPLIDGKMTKRDRPMGFWDYQAGGRGMKSRQILKQQRAAQAKGELAPPDEEDSEAKYPNHPLDQMPGHSAWIDGNYKLHRIPKGNNVTYQLYDLEADEKETTDIASRHADRVQKMKAALNDWQVSVIKSLNGEDYK